MRCLGIKLHLVTNEVDTGLCLRYLSLNDPHIEDDPILNTENIVELCDNYTGKLARPVGR